MGASRRCCGSCRTWRRGSSSRGKVLGRGEGVRTWERAADGSSTRSRERHKAPGRMLDPASCPDGGTNVRKTATRRVMVDSSPHAGNKCGSRFTSWSSGAPSPHAGNKPPEGGGRGRAGRPIPVCGERTPASPACGCPGAIHPRVWGTNPSWTQEQIAEADPSPCVGNERLGSMTEGATSTIHPRVWGTNPSSHRKVRPSAPSKPWASHSPEMSKAPRGASPRTCDYKFASERVAGVAGILCLS
mgnify:CR=1 FL=1